MNAIAADYGRRDPQDVMAITKRTFPRRY
jgi:hypothetical protein